MYDSADSISTADRVFYTNNSNQMKSSDLVAQIRDQRIPDDRFLGLFSRKDLNLSDSIRKGTRQQ